MGLFKSHEYNLFFEKEKMHFTQSLNSMHLENIFLNSPSPGLESSGQQALWDFKSFMECDDSIKYVSQFLDLEEELPQMPQLDLDHLLQQVQAPLQPSEERNKERSFKVEKKKKIQKTLNSPFHNYQKHLNNALKKLIIVPEFDNSNESYKRAACEIWEQYLTLEIKTKRILHYIFNENNEHIINDSELHTYGLWDILQTYGAFTFNKAKTFLSKLAIDQIDEQNIDGYLKTRKLKRMEGFKEYILQFRTELSNGYLKRRVNLEMQN